MLLITLDFATGKATLSNASPIVAGVSVEVQINCVRSGAAESPGDTPVFQLALGTDATPPVMLAYLETFEAENESTFTGFLDAADTRLVTYMATKGVTTLNAELRWTVAGKTQAAPHFSVSIQPSIIPVDPNTESGPVYQTQAQADARYAQLANFLAIFLGLDLSTLPTSDPGNGQMWSNGGVPQVGP